MAQDIPLDKLSIKDDSFQLLKSLPVDLFNKIVKGFRLQELVNLHDKAPGSDHFNDQIYALTLKTLTIMDGSNLTIMDGSTVGGKKKFRQPSKFYDNSRVHLPAKFYGSSRVFCPVQTKYLILLDIRYLSEFPEHLKQYVKNINVNCFREAPPEDFNTYKERQGFMNAAVASFVNSFSQLDKLSITSWRFKFQDNIVAQVKELRCYVHDNVLDNFNTEHLEILKLRLLDDDSTVAAPKYKPDSMEFSQKLGKYRLPKLHTLSFPRYFFSAYWEIDFQYLKNMPQLATCHFTKCKVLNLREEYVPKLQSIDTVESHIDEIALPQLTTFDNVELEGRATETYGSLECLTTLKLFKCGLLSAEKVSNLQRLESLDLSWNSIENLKPVSHLKSLKTLEARRNNVRVIPSLDNLTHLTKLDLSNNDITTITGLENLTSLKELDLYNNNITSLACLSGLTNLRHLDVSYNRGLRALDGALSRCHKLELLSLDDCAIKKLERLDNFTRLKTLLVSDNSLTALDNLDGQKQSLKFLCASRNKISSITQDLSQFSVLEMLWLEENKITSFENINCIPELKDLELGFNPVASVDRPLSYPKLESFDISKTRITSMEGLEGVEKQVPEVREQVERNLQYDRQRNEGDGDREKHVGWVILSGDEDSDSFEDSE